MTRALVVLAAFVVLVAGAVAHAEGRDVRLQEAKRRFQRANQLYQDGRYEDALHLYQAAYDLVPSPDILFNLALTKEKVFDYEGCALSFRRYLDETAARQPNPQAAERLERCRAQATIPVKVSSMPPSAAVVLDDGKSSTQRGRTPAQLTLPPGRYTISVAAPGYIPQKQEVEVREGVHPEIDFTLEKLSTLHIEADVAGAEVQLDDKPAGITPVQRELQAGVYAVRVSKPGFRVVTRQVRVNAGDQVSLMLSLPPLPREHELEVRVEPPLPSTVAIDGRDAGRAPLSQRLVAGAHRLEVSSPAHLPWVGEVQVPEDRDLLLEVRLTPRRPRGARIFFWTMEGVASALAGAGVVVGSLALADQATFNAHPSVALHDRGHAEALTSDLLFGASAVVGLGVGIWYLATWPRASRGSLTAR